MQRPSKSRPKRPVGILAAWRLSKPGTTLTPEPASAMSSLAIAPQVLTGPTSLTSPPVDNSLIKTALPWRSPQLVPTRPRRSRFHSRTTLYQRFADQLGFPSWEASRAVKQETSGVNYLADSSTSRVAKRLKLQPAAQLKDASGSTSAIDLPRQ